MFKAGPDIVSALGNFQVEKFLKKSLFQASLSVNGELTRQIGVLLMNTGAKSWSYEEHVQKFCISEIYLIHCKQVVHILPKRYPGPHKERDNEAFTVITTQ